jgi:hypothetical protein
VRLNALNVIVRPRFSNLSATGNKILVEICDSLVSGKGIIVSNILR